MTPPPKQSPEHIRSTLIKLTRAWAWRQTFDAAQARELRRQAILINHAHYLEHIPAYRRVADEAGLGPLNEIESIKKHLLLPDEIFKSYDQSWLDQNNFVRMNAWLSEIFHRQVEINTDGLQSIDAWLDRLETAGIRIVYSSGTSGTFSFIPRDPPTIRLFRTASTAYLIPLLMHQKVGSLLQRLLIRATSQWLPPDAFTKVRWGAGLSDYDAVFLDFNGGRTGNQSLEQELAPAFRKHYFLYDIAFSPSVLRLIARGAETEADREKVKRFQELVVGHKAQNYRRIIDQIKQATAEGQKIFIFGAPYQCKELLEALANAGGPVPLRAGSLILFGGGWKSFTGEKLSRDQLATQLSENFCLPPEMILEGYSMTELSAFTLRCDYGRFHIPPLIEPLILDEELMPLEGPNLRGTFAFLDPLALAYPGFIISGDEVHLVDGDCPCGLTGPAVTEIGRARAREVKGCGGIVASAAA